MRVYSVPSRYVAALVAPLNVTMQEANLFLADLETSRKETKVRLRGHELKQARHSSAKAKEEVRHTSFSMCSRFGRR